MPPLHFPTVPMFQRSLLSVHLRILALLTPTPQPPSPPPLHPTLFSQPFSPHMDTPKLTSLGDLSGINMLKYKVTQLISNTNLVPNSSMIHSPRCEKLKTINDHYLRKTCFLINYQSENNLLHSFSSIHNSHLRSFISCWPEQLKTNGKC